MRVHACEPAPRRHGLRAGVAPGGVLHGPALDQDAPLTGGGQLPVATGPAERRRLPPGPPGPIAAVTLSGGGARAAAFGLGVLQELKATRFELDGRPTTLLDEVGLISGVSGGSILAGYYAAFGDEVFTRFERDFLLVNFQSGLMRAVLSPRTLYQPHLALVGPQQRAGAPARHRLPRHDFRRTAGAASRPRLLVTATDLTTGAPFEFTPEQFALICSDLDHVPLSFAVAASSSVPLLLSPMTVRNYAGSCPPGRRTRMPTAPNATSRPACCSSSPKAMATPGSGPTCTSSTAGWPTTWACAA